MGRFISSVSLGSPEVGILGTRTVGDFMYTDFEFNYDDKLAEFSKCAASQTIFSQGGLKYIPSVIMEDTSSWHYTDHFDIDINKGIPIQLCDKKYALYNDDYEYNFNLYAYAVDRKIYNMWNDNLIEEDKAWNMFYGDEYCGPGRGVVKNYIDTYALLITSNEHPKWCSLGSVNIRCPYGYQFLDISAGCGGRVRMFSVDEEYLPRRTVNIRGSKKLFQSMAMVTAVNSI